MSVVNDRALLIDSSFGSRRELLGTLRATDLFAAVEEAESVSHGYLLLDEGRSDACFLGPSLKENVALEFIRRASVVPRSRPCAFVAVRNDEAAVDKFQEVGATALLRAPWGKTAFKDVVSRAITRSKAREPGDLIVNPFEEEPVAVTRTLDRILSTLAGDLRGVVEDLSSGKLKLSPNGRPSLATQDALRLVLEQAHPNAEVAATIGTFDHHFVTSVVEWFSERTTTPAKAATEQLRRRLVSFSRKS